MHVLVYDELLKRGVMNRTYAWILGVIIILGILTFFALESIWKPTQQEQSSVQKQIDAIDSEIAKLKDELHRYRKEALNEEIQAQDLMQVEWSDYAKKLKLIEENRDKANLIEKRIEELQNERKSLK